MEKSLELLDPLHESSSRFAKRLINPFIEPEQLINSGMVYLGDCQFQSRITGTRTRYSDTTWAWLKPKRRRSAPGVRSAVLFYAWAATFGLLGLPDAVCGVSISFAMVRIRRLIAQRELVEIRFQKAAVLANDSHSARMTSRFERMNCDKRISVTKKVRYTKCCERLSLARTRNRIHRSEALPIVSVGNLKCLTKTRVRFVVAFDHLTPCWQWNSPTERELKLLRACRSPQLLSFLP